MVKFLVPYFYPLKLVNIVEDVPTVIYYIIINYCSHQMGPYVSPNI